MILVHSSEIETLKNLYSKGKKTWFIREDFDYEKYEPEIECVRLLTEARKKQNITQKELSKMTGIRQSNLSRIETGICSPTLDTLQKIAVSLGKKLTIQIK